MTATKKKKSLHLVNSIQSSIRFYKSPVSLGLIFVHKPINTFKLSKNRNKPNFFCSFCRIFNPIHTLQPNPSNLRVPVGLPVRVNLRQRTLKKRDPRVGGFGDRLPGAITIDRVMGKAGITIGCIFSLYY